MKILASKWSELSETDKLVFKGKSDQENLERQNKFQQEQKDYHDNKKQKIKGKEF